MRKLGNNLRRFGILIFLVNVFVFLGVAFENFLDITLKNNVKKDEEFDELSIFNLLGSFELLLLLIWLRIDY